MRIVEFIHDEDHPLEKSNIDLWVEKSDGYTAKKINVYQQAELPNFYSYDLLILHGGAQHLWDKDADPWLFREIQYVRKALERGKPVIGFCLGSQIISEALGARAFKAEVKEIGWYRIIPKPEARGHLLLKNLGDGFTTFLWHSDHYELPKGCTTLGFTKDAQNQIIVSNCFPAVGFQFHPEYTKEIIRTYTDTYCDSWWGAGTDPLIKKDFQKELESVPETYDLFVQLIENSIEWISTIQNAG